MVYVISKSGKPLMPTTRYRHVRILLKEKRAYPVCNHPFTIRLKYNTPEIIQEFYLGVDPGRENIGIGVSKENGECVYLAELQTNNKMIKKNMDGRRSYRRSRRRNRRIRNQRKAIRDYNQMSKNVCSDTLKGSRPCMSREYRHPGCEEPVVHKAIKGKEPRFQNRRRKDGWLTPSARQLIQMHLGFIKKIMEFLPIRAIILERNAFDFQKLEDQDIKDWQYSKGPLYGYNSYKDYVHALQNGVCLLCGDRPIAQYHHIRSRNKGGSDSVKNIAGLCEACHNGDHGVHKDMRATKELEAKKEGLLKKYRVSLLNSVMLQLIRELSEYCHDRGISFFLTDGHETYAKRNGLEIEKRHCLDGYIISLARRETDNHNLPSEILHYRRFKKKSAANISKFGRREYYAGIDGKKELVAINRNKAEGQMIDSLAEYKETYLSSHTEQELRDHLKSLTVKPAKRIYTAHQDGISCSIHAGDTVVYEKKTAEGRIRREVFTAERVSPAKNSVLYGTKGKNLKYCKIAKRGAIAHVYTERAYYT